MAYSNSSFNNDRSTVMTTEQLDGVVDAILAGKYSWACFLILRSVGYNPMHYIPYRTCNRLMKEHLQSYGCKKNKNTRQKSEDAVATARSRKLSDLIEDLPYLESLDSQKVQVKGGFQSFYSSIFSVSSQDLDIH